MFPFSSFSMLSLLYVGALLSSDASPVCMNSPCKENLVAAPIQPGTGAGVGTAACEGQTGTTACRTVVSIPAISDVPRKVERKHELPQFQYKVTDISYSTFCYYFLQFSAHKSWTGATFNQPRNPNRPGYESLTVYSSCSSESKQHTIKRMPASSFSWEAKLGTTYQPEKNNRQQSKKG